MCILLKLDYAMFGVSNLFLSKGIDKKPLGGGGRIQFAEPTKIESLKTDRLNGPLHDLLCSTVKLNLINEICIQLLKSNV